MSKEIKKVQCKYCNSIYENDKVPTDDANQYYCPLCDSIRCFKEYQPRPTSKKVEEALNRIANYVVVEEDDCNFKETMYMIMPEAFQLIQKALAVSDDSERNVHMFEHLYNKFDELDSDQILTLIKQRVIANRKNKLNEISQPNLDTLKEKIIEHIYNDEELTKKYHTDWKFHKYVDYAITNNMAWNELMEYIAFNLLKNLNEELSK